MKVQDICKACESFVAENNVNGIKVILADNSSTSEAGLTALNSLIPDFHPAILHDPAGAPYATAKSPFIDSIHISLTDEDCYAAAIAVICSPSSSLAGVGIDLASVTKTNSISTYDLLFFQPDELEHLSSLSGEEKFLASTILFSYKESAIKALADLARPDILKDEFCYDDIDLKQFSISLSGPHSATIHPIGKAKAACQKLGVRQFEGAHFSFDSYIYSVVKVHK